MSENKIELNEEQIPVVEETNENTNKILDNDNNEEIRDKTSEKASKEEIKEAFSKNNEDLLKAAQLEAEKQKEFALRTMADMENLRRRTRIDIEKAHKFALAKFVHELIPVLDSMEMGLDASVKEDASAQSIHEGLEMTFKLFLDVMQKFDVERIDPAGEKFDPKLHEAMTMVPSPEYESQAVIEVFQKGYVLNERLVRAARVIVAK